MWRLPFSSCTFGKMPMMRGMLSLHISYQKWNFEEKGYPQFKLLVLFESGVTVLMFCKALVPIYILRIDAFVLCNLFTRGKLLIGLHHLEDVINLPLLFNSIFSKGTSFKLDQFNTRQVITVW